RPARRSGSLTRSRRRGGTATRGWPVPRAERDAGVVAAGVGERSQQVSETPAWIRRFRAARVTLPSWAADAPHRLAYATNASGVWQVMSWDLDSGEHRRLTDKETGVLGGRPTPDGAGIVWFDDNSGD